MVERGEIGLAPSDGRQVVLDARSGAHDHFVCTVCGTILDIALPDSTIAMIQEQLGRHLVRDGIVVRGRCERCGPLVRSPLRHCCKETLMAFARFMSGPFGRGARIVAGLALAGARHRSRPLG